MHANTDNHANVYVCCFLFFLDLLISLDIVLLPRSSSSHTLGSASVFPSTGMSQILTMHKINIDLVGSTPVAPLLLQCLCRLCYFQYFFLTHFTPTPPRPPSLCAFRSWRLNGLIFKLHTSQWLKWGVCSGATLPFTNALAWRGGRRKKSLLI